ncbi:nucleocapsid, partial [Sierra Nevada virus]
QLYKFHKQSLGDTEVAETIRAPVYQRPLSALCAGGLRILKATDPEESYGVGLSCVLRCFPEVIVVCDLSAIVTEVVPNPETLLEEGSAEDKPMMVQFGAYVCLATLCYLVKPKTAENTAYVKNRWQALVGTRGFTDLITGNQGLDTRAMDMADVDARRISATTLKAQLVRAIRDYPDGTLGPTLQALISQVRMVYKGHGMAMLSEMVYLIKTQPMRRVLLQSTVADEAVKLDKAIEEAKKKHGEDFEYLGALGISEESLHHKNFPNLYYAAKALAQGENRISQGMQFSSLPTGVDKEVLRKEALRTIQTKKEVTPELIEKLKRLGHDVTGVTLKEARKKRRAADSDEEGMSP